MIKATVSIVILIFVFTTMVPVASVKLCYNISLFR